MTAINVRPLGDEFTFGARIAGVTRDNLSDPEVCREIKTVFEDRGLIVFEDVEQSGEMQLALSVVIGPLKEHPVAAVSRVDRDTMPGVIDLRYEPGADVTLVEIKGKRLANWLPWHFDHCYNNELNRAGILRALTIPPEGGLTGFADGIQLYRSLSPELREEIEGRNVVYTLDLVYGHMRFGKPAGFRVLQEHPGQLAYSEMAKQQPRAIHPAVWTRKSGEKVLHVSPWMSVGIEGDETPHGAELLERVCNEIISKVKAYYHQWKSTEMLTWDNWRILHCVSGTDPKYRRRLHRTTIEGDYGLGYFEGNRQGDRLLEMTV
jgi:taurine dioxygenase